MKREITEYETNNLDTLKFIKWCKKYIYVYNHKTIMLNEVSKEIWKMIQEDVFNVNYSEISLTKLIADIGYFDFMQAMFYLCYNVIQKEEDYIYDRNFKGIDSISLIGEPIYKFMHRIEELIPYED